MAPYILRNYLFLFVFASTNGNTIQTWEECHIHLTNTELHQEVCNRKSEYIDYHFVDAAQQSIVGLSRQGKYDLIRNPSRDELADIVNIPELRSFAGSGFTGTGFLVASSSFIPQVSSLFSRTLTADMLNQTFDPELYTLESARSLKILLTATLPSNSIDTGNLDLDSTNHRVVSPAGRYLGLAISNLVAGFGLDVLYFGTHLSQAQHNWYESQFMSTSRALQNFPVAYHFLSNEFPSAYARIQTCAGDMSMEGIVYVLVCPYWELDFNRTFETHVLMRRKGLRQWIRRKLEPNPSWRTPLRAVYRMSTL